MSKVSAIYQGPLSREHAQKGIDAALTNAIRLVFEANRLYEQELFATAVAIGSVALEEFAKFFVLQALSEEVDPRKIQKLWKDYRNHRSKAAPLVYALLGFSQSDGPNELTFDVERIISEYSHDHPEHNSLNKARQLSLYSDCECDEGEPKWTIPHESITPAIARTFVMCLFQVMPLFAVESSRQRLTTLVNEFRAAGERSKEDFANAIRDFAQKLVKATQDNPAGGITVRVK